MLLAATIVVAAAVAACGGSSSSGSASGAAAKDAATSSRAAFTSCLKQHGVTVPSGAGKFKRGSGGGGFPAGKAPTNTSGAPSAGTGGAPGAGSGGSGGGGFGAGGFGNSKFAKAMKACQSKLPASERGRFGAGKRPGNFKPSFSATTLKKFVGCIRENGYAAMPEPSKNSNGGFFPKSVENNADFKKALPKCQSILRQGFQHPAGTSTSVQSS